jgi:NAD(P)-dependent dehydrogenase (short-subunit alcohol dehydrogenase family)
VTAPAQQPGAVLVTGGAHGIGRAVAGHCAAAGRPAILVDLDAEGLQTAAAELTREGAQVRFHAGDVSDRTVIAAAVEDAVATFGRLSGLVAVAGIADVRPLLEVTDEDWQRVIDVNLTGVFRCTQECARAMRDTGGGAIVAIASTNAFWVEQNMAPYNSSKGGVVAFVRSAALDLAPYGIRINAVAPGVVRTRISSWVIDDPELGPQYLEKIPLHRFGEVEDVAGTVDFLLGDTSSYITGQMIVLDGGQTLGIPLEARDVVMPGTARHAS